MTKIKLVSIIALVMISLSSSNYINAQRMNLFPTIFEQNNTLSADYDQTMTYYESLAQEFLEINMIEAGPSDIGRPIHLVIISNDGVIDVDEIDRSKKSILLINNAIHPGEPCGIDASMMLTRDLMINPSLKKLLEQTVIILIPMYNISGVLNRSSTSRANQEGPAQYGFRGNIQQLDLNRDFIKTLSKNAKTFNRLFSHWKPDMMIDNHTSNGADYQYTMTLISTQKDKLVNSQTQLLSESILPYLFKNMEAKNWPMTPYVYAQSTPDKGIAGFLDLARYSSGYAALHHCISFMPETHMLKPYKDRVNSTYDFMQTALEYLNFNGQKLRQAKADALQEYANKDEFPINWTMDKNVVDKLNFKGYEAKYKKSLIHGQDRLYYDRERPFEMEIDFWNTYKETTKCKKPSAYIVPQAYVDVIQRLKNNNVEMSRIKEDRVIDVTMYYIDQFESSKYAYEGRYLHKDITLKTITRKREYYKGDYLVKLNQEANRYILETMEPNAPDSYFAWGFFDGILMQKEYFSSYVFEDLAVEILKENPGIKKALELKKKEDPEFNNDAYGQLEFIYRRSQYFEDSYKLYPVGRIE